LPRRDWHPLVAPAFLWTRNDLIRPQQQRRRLYVAQMSVAWASTILSMGLDNKRVKLDGSG
jgi:hypothetical protein